MSTGPLVREALGSSGVEGTRRLRRRRRDVHHKPTFVSHPAAASGGTRLVLTGSDNYTERSLTRPELLLRLHDAGDTYRRYDRWVDGLVARGAREQG